MPFVRVDADDPAAVAELTDLYNTCAAVDDPDSLPAVAAEVESGLRFGSDLHPAEHFLYTPEGDSAPVGELNLFLPVHDNLRLAEIGVLVTPARRRQGHGSAMVTEALQRVREAGRSTVWIGGVEGDPASVAFAERHGFRYASHDARRRQVLAEVDAAVVDELFRQAQAKAEGYRLERLEQPYSDELLAELVDVTEAINDAPMGELTFENPTYDVERLRDIETAQRSRGWRIYRMAAREISSGIIGGHTFVVISPHQERHAWQWDTAVSRAHRGHRLGMLLKIAMMRWLAEAEPQILTIDTWNNADNAFMISVNESIGYRLSQTMATYERILTG